MLNDYSIGDRIRVVYSFPGGGPTSGDEGTIVKVYPYSLGVRFDKCDENKFHNCDGLCESGHGWFIFREDFERKRVELVTSDDLEDTSFDEICLMMEGRYA